MKRSNLYDTVEERLSLLVTRVRVRAKGNILNLNLHSEYFYASFLNHLFDWNLVNTNLETENSAAIDLEDTQEKIIAQVSSTADKKKIENSLCKQILREYSGFNFKFIALTNDVLTLRKKKFHNPHKLNFEPEKDIHDVQSLLRHFQGLDLDKQEKVAAIVSKEIPLEDQRLSMDSNLAAVINIISREPLGEGVQVDFNTEAFDIEKKISYNELVSFKMLINDHKIHHARLQKVYDMYDLQGANKSASILNRMRTAYCKARLTLPKGSSDEVFQEVLAQTSELVVHSSNYETIPCDELELCVQILVVDAFIRCKIFEPPPKES